MSSRALAGKLAAIDSDPDRGRPRPPVGAARLPTSGRDRGTLRPTWRDEARLSLLVAGAATMSFVPPAAMVVEQISWAFAAFAAGVSVCLLGSTALQIVTLRLTRYWASPPLSWPWQLFATALVGVAVHLALKPIIPYSVDLGLDASGEWKSVIAAWTTVMLACYLVWEREAHARYALAARRLRDVQRAQRALRRSIVEAQLLAVQARVDPSFFFATLDGIELLYRRDTMQAEKLFDELVTFLRAALPNLDSVSSTLARELELAQSTVRIHALVTGRGLELRLDIDDALLCATFPAGVLLPLLRDALDTFGAEPAAPGEALRIRASLAGAPPQRMLHLCIDTPGEVSTATRDAVAHSLRALFGDATSLHARRGGTAATVVELRIPHDA